MTMRTPGQIVHHLHTLRTSIADANREVDKLKCERDLVETELLEALEAQGVVRVSSATHTASITKETVPTVTDWDAFYEFMRTQDKLYMLHRRPSSSAYRDELDAREGEAIPGVEPFTKRGISLRKSS